MILGLVAILMGVMMMGGVVSAAPGTVTSDGATSGGSGGGSGTGGGGTAATCSNDTFLGLRAWWAGLPKDDKCNIKVEDKDALSGVIWGVVANVLFSLFVVVGYLAIGFIMFGGYTYLLARGDPGKIEKGKKTLVSAVTGLIIALLASLIVAFISDNIIFGG